MKNANELTSVSGFVPAYSLELSAEKMSLQCDIAELSERLNVCLVKPEAEADDFFNCENEFDYLQPLARSAGIDTKELQSALHRLEIKLHDREDERDFSK